MKAIYLNCFSCAMRFPPKFRTGGVVILLETDRGLILVDSGVAEADYTRKPLVLRSFQVLTEVPLDPEETAVRQIARLGFNPDSVKDIVLTHMNFDHCGGITDFPHARIHVLRKELDAFLSPHLRWADHAYLRHHTAHKPIFELYDMGTETWNGFPAVRLQVDPEMYLIPLHGHSAGHCGVAIRIDEAWLFHVGDAAPVAFDESLPAWFVRMVLGPHTGRLRAFQEEHPEIKVTTGHMLLEDPLFRSVLE